ncbi:hypothetical protein NBRC110019_31650 [Neptunitalea chrysea]|uniref:Lipoprotein n=1 Tax=Neptunitalea chrysea TaxID=1647581 RepID=A0A9W6EVQ8_9FLAO|nr:DUF6263 family protein [Neptunitalea chrysea]GLB54124.1 hypothetical protein NBRC110019_31650 [Neptunitalea chrysea]
MKNVFLAVVAMALLLTSCESDKEGLSLRLKKGETYWQYMTSAVTMKQEFMGQKMNITMKVISDVSYKVTDLTNDVFTFEVTYDKIAVETSLPQATMKFTSEENDSSNPMSELMYNMLHTLTKESFILKMDKTGKVKDINGLDELFDKMIATLGDLPSAEKEQIKKEMASSFGEDQFKGNIELVSAIFPDKEVGENQFWNVEIDLPSLNSSVGAKYHVTEETSDYYIIEGNAEISKKDIENAPKLMNTNVSLLVDGTLTSRIKIDKKTGWTKEAKMIEHLEGDVLMSVDPSTGEAMKMPIVLNQEIDVKDTNK